jgi:hypothetical protein
MENLAWVEEMNRSDIVRQAADQFIKTGFKGITPIPPDDEYVRVRFVIDEDVWDKLGTKAWKLFTTPSVALRAVITQLVKDVPVERKLAAGG